MNDECLLERGYKKYNPTPFDSCSVVARFQKRFDDEYGIKYFIDILKWSNDYIPKENRDKWYKPFTYNYEIQFTVSEEEKSLNMEFFPTWTIEEVENFAEEMFLKMQLNHYELK